MFTGLIETVGQVVAVSGDSPRRIAVACDFPDCAVGDSVAIDGCCLTVVALAPLTFELATETLARTTLGGLVAGTAVNLERALRFGDRLGGHLVAGHVDAVGTVMHHHERGGAWYLGVEVSPEVARLCAPRGSVVFSGVSLTVTAVQGDLVEVCLIPHTRAVTTLGRLKIGDTINVEADMLARYVARALETRGL